jgi:hypothetical protein
VWDNLPEKEKGMLMRGEINCKKRGYGNGRAERRAILLESVYKAA